MNLTPSSSNRVFTCLYTERTRVSLSMSNMWKNRMIMQITLGQCFICIVINTIDEENISFTKICLTIAERKSSRFRSFTYMFFLFLFLFLFLFPFFFLIMDQTVTWTIWHLNKYVFDVAYYQTKNLWLVEILKNKLILASCLFTKTLSLKIPDWKVYFRIIESDCYSRVEQNTEVRA